MAKIYDRVHLLMRKHNRLKEEHGVERGTELFLAEHPDGIDEIMNYVIRCSTVENHQRAEAEGYPPGTCVIPMYREA
jgi:hypothetical protein